MKRTFLFFTVVCIVAAIAACSRRTYTHRPITNAESQRCNTMRVIVTLPDDWREYDSQWEPAVHYFGRKENPIGLGNLRITLHPPTFDHHTTAEDAEKELSDHVDDLFKSGFTPTGRFEFPTFSIGYTTENQQRCVLTHEQAASGFMATTIFKTYGQFYSEYWLIQGEVTVFAEYTRGAGYSKEESEKVAQIMRTLRLK
jgi:hypothetical protein